MWIIKKIFKILGNIYWKIFGGIFLAVIWFWVAIIFFISIIGIPLSLQLFKISYLCFKPFNKTTALVMDRPIISFIWILTFGFIIGIVTIINAAVQVLTIVGIPLLKQWWKVSVLAFFPFCNVID